MKKLITFLFLLTAFYSNAQNNLNKITGLESTTASVAYSLRQLSTSYTGPLVRIKVGSSFYDVYPDASTTKFSLNSKISAPISTYNDAVAVASGNALSSIITPGTTNATVAIWYDQSGNGVHVLSSNPNAKIITAGSMNTMNGQPTINFTGTNSYLTSSTTVNYSTQTHATVNAVAQDVASTNYISGILTTGDNGGWGLCYDPTTTIKGYWVDASGGNGAFSNEHTSEAKIVTGTIGTPASGTSSFIYINGTQKGTKVAQNLANGTTDKIYVGSRGNFTGRQFIGNISETMMFPKTLSAAERAALESSQSIFLPPTVTITSSASGAVCAGTNVTFTASISGFTNPYYQWYANGTPISGATSATYSTTSLVNGDQVNVKVNEGPFGGSVTSSGLLLNLDATNPTSYPGSGSTWNNLVTGNEVTNFTISAGGAYSTDNGGVIRFGNTGGGASSSTGFSNLSAYTVEVWVKPAGTMGGYDPSVEGNTNYTPCFFAEIVHNSGAGNRVNMVLAYNARGLTFGTANNSYRYEAAINNGSWKKHQIPTNYSSDLNNWVQIISTYDGSKLTIYRNGVSLGSSAALGIASLRTPSIGYWIAHRWDMVDAVYGDYSKVMMYDRALTSAEVSANYSAFNARFVDNSVSSSAITTTVNASPAVPVLTVLGDGCINKTTLSTPAGLSVYAWYKDNVPISGAISNTYSPTTAGEYKVQVTSGTCSTMSATTTISVCGVTADGSMRPAETSAVLISREGATNNGYVIDDRGSAFTKPVPQIAAFDFVNPPNNPTVQRTWTSTINGVTATIRGNPTYTSTNGGGLQLVSGSSIDINGINTATTSFTLSMVVDPPTNTDGHYNVFYDGKSGGGRQGNAIWANFWGTTINVGINSEQGVNAGTPVAGITRYDFVYDGTSVKVYKNASIVANGTIPVSNGGWSSNLRIGEEYENVGNFFNGKIYRIKYQKTALDQSAITTQYNAEKTW